MLTETFDAFYLTSGPQGTTIGNASSLYSFEVIGANSVTGELIPGNTYRMDAIFNSAIIDSVDAVFVGQTSLQGGTGPVGLMFTIATSGPNGSFLPGDLLFTDDLTIPNLTPIATDTSSSYFVCFAEGTLIATPEGETPVECLRIGDPVLTADGRTVPVKWIGRQTLLRAFCGERARPVRIAAGTLGDSLPHTDLVLTADHALILDGLAINAGALVNGTSITRDPAPARATYYHIETEAHDVILANGAPAETYVDYAARRAFDNHAEYVALYGEDQTITEMPLPRVSAARLVPVALQRRLARRAVA